MKRVISALMLFGAAVACSDSTAPSTNNTAPPLVGAKLTLSTLTSGGFDGSGSSPCDAFVKTTGTVRAVSQRAIVVTDDDSPAAFTTADYEAIAAEFDNITYPTDVSYFGEPTDLDNNGHIILYYTPSVNKLSPPGTAGTSGYVGGFFFAGDLFDPTGIGGCAASNKREIFYLLTPDPSATFGNAFSVDFVRAVTSGTVAHEFQHMLNAGHRYESNAASFESTWLDEGMAHFAEGAVGRVAAGFGDLQTLSVTDMANVDVQLYNAFFIQNFSRAKYYVSRPDTTGPIVGRTRAGTNLASRGASWALLRYTADWFSAGDPRALTRKLAAGPDTGTTNLTTAAGASLDTLLARWMVTMYTDHLGIQGLDPVYNYKSYHLRDLITQIHTGSNASGSYLPVTTLGTGATISANVPASSGSYFLVAAGSGARTIQVTGSGTPSTGADATLSNLGTMAVGNVRVLTYGQAQNGLTIPGSMASAQYVIVVASVAANTDVVTQYSVSGDWISPNGPATTAALNAPVGRQQSLPVAYTDVGGTRGAQFEAALRQYERQGMIAASRGFSAQVAPPVSATLGPPIDYVRLYVVRIQ